MITCPICGATSHHPEDVRQGYCGKCHAFTRKCEFCDKPPAYIAGNISLCKPHAQMVGVVSA